MFQLLGVPAINRIFYSFKRSEAFESVNITHLVLSILVILKRPYRYSQILELENCPTYNFVKFFIQFLLRFVYPYILKSWRFWRCHLTNLVLNMLTVLVLYHFDLPLIISQPKIQRTFEIIKVTDSIRKMQYW